MTEFYYPSCGSGNIHACRWEPDGQIKGIVQILHGIAEYARRYEEFARYLNSLGYLVVAEDHMGHGLSIGQDQVQGYFEGGWFAAIEDSYQLLTMTQQEYPDVPYILFGHSMGSFMARTMLIRYPQMQLDGAIICGTGWMKDSVLKMGSFVSKMVCKFGDEKKPSKFLHKLMFGSYNKRVEKQQTEFDWLSFNPENVKAYIADPLCGFPETAGLARDMLTGILFIQKKDNLEKMNPELPVLFVAGAEDPVGDYGAGVKSAASEFADAGMKQISCRIYPKCRHEILNEQNKNQIFESIAYWMNIQLSK